MLISVNSAVDMARYAMIDPKAFRRALSSYGSPWHRPNERWLVLEGSPEHEDMILALRELVSSRKT